MPLRNTEEAIKNEQSRETGNIGYTIRRKKTQQNMCWSPLCVNKHNTIRSIRHEPSYKSRQGQARTSKLYIFRQCIYIVYLREHKKQIKM